MNSRQQSRLIAALLLLLAACGIARFTVPTAGSEPSIVYSRTRQRAAIRRNPEPIRTAIRQHRAAKVTTAPVKLQQAIFCRSLFQRPPPVSSSLA
ncbi:MAG TPA: hypothetical protein VML19_14550 [Verrucomicrobiae bacterium]|nr:hypothetical protein [Verrucomicrobiae bacterium]